MTTSARTVPSDIRFLLNDDNYFTSMRNMWSDFRNDLGRKSSFDLQRLPDLYDQRPGDWRSRTAEYDVVSVNMPWLGRVRREGLLAPLDDTAARRADQPARFSSLGLGHGQLERHAIRHSALLHDRDPRRPARPVRGTGSRLSARPSTRRSRPRARCTARPSEFYGIAWNGQRGMPIANSFMFFLAACQKTSSTCHCTIRTAGASTGSRS